MGKKVTLTTEANASPIAGKLKVPLSVRLSGDAVETLNALCILSERTQADILETCLFAHAPAIREEAAKRRALTQELSTLASKAGASPSKPQSPKSKATNP